MPSGLRLRRLFHFPNSGSPIATAGNEERAVVIEGDGVDSGFVAEMTVFMGSWQHPDAFRRIATIAACLSIVVTAVYILRAIGQTAMGPIKEGYRNLTDAAWNEKLAAAILIIGIVAIGTAPFWLNDLISPGTELIMEKIRLLQ